MTTRDGPAIGTGLLHSADGGAHFALEPGAIPGIACSYSPASDTVIWSYCSGGHLMYAYLSADAGAHFTAAGPSEPPRTTPDGYAFWDHNGATYQASTAQLWHTTDTGTTWSPVTALP